MNYIGCAIVGCVLGYVVYGAITSIMEEWFGYNCYRDEQKKSTYRRIFWTSVAACIVPLVFFGPPAIERMEAREEERRVEHEASLTKVTVVVTDIESVPNSASSRYLTGFLILTVEHPRQKLFVPICYIEKVSVGDMLDLKLDGWNVVGAAHAETMPVPHKK